MLLLAGGKRPARTESGDETTRYARTGAEQRLNLQVVSDQLFSGQFPHQPGHTAYYLIKVTGGVLLASGKLLAPTESEDETSNPHPQIHNLTYLPLYYDHNSSSGNRTLHFQLERLMNYPFIRWSLKVADAGLEPDIWRLRVSCPNHLD